MGARKKRETERKTGLAFLVRDNLKSQKLLLDDGLLTVGKVSVRRDRKKIVFIVYTPPKSFDKLDQIFNETNQGTTRMVQ